MPDDNERLLIKNSCTFVCCSALNEPLEVEDDVYSRNVRTQLSPLPQLRQRRRNLPDVVMDLSPVQSFAPEIAHPRALSAGAQSLRASNGDEYNNVVIPTAPPSEMPPFCPLHGYRGLSDGEAGRGPGLARNRSSRRDDPRRHTLGGNQHLYVNPHQPAQGQRDVEIPQQQQFNTNTRQRRENIIYQIDV